MSPFEVVLGITHLLARLASPFLLPLRIFSRPVHSAFTTGRFSYLVKRQGRRREDRPSSLSCCGVWKLPGKSGVPAQMDCESLVIRDE